MKSEGPYTIKNTVNDLWLVYGPKGPLSGNIGHALAVEICVVANSGYAEGRKAERERCAKIAESHVTKLYGYQIADAIRGGQDGK